MPTLARRLGPFDATMIVMGGIIGSGIFINPYVVARQVHTPALIVAGFIFRGGQPPTAVLPDRNVLLSFGAAMTPVMFAYGGWQTASFVSGEMKRPERDLTIGLLLGVAGVITIYLLVNIVCIRVLGTSGLAATTTPASAVMRTVLGERGARLIATGIAVSALGF